MFADGSESEVTVRRRAGGYVEIRERTADEDAVRSTAGGAAISEADLAELQRGARIAPRNLLAHARERGVVVPDDRPADGEVLLAYPDESVVYAFDASTYLCRRLEDRARDVAVAYADYRDVSGIVTPFLETHTRLDGTPLFREEFVRVEYGF